MATLQSLARRLNDEADKIDDKASDIAAEAAEIIVSALVYDTPVDTSKALSNWQVTLGSASSTSIPPHALGVGGSTRAVSADTAIRLAQAVLAGKQPGQTIYISNGLPYIRRLNSGWSKQHPGAFVEAAILLARNYVRERYGG